MIRSKRFWIGAFLLATVPLLIVDVVEHYQSWKKDVREELIVAVQDMYSFTREQKADILDRVFERNQTLGFLIYAKVFLSVAFLCFGIYFISLAKKLEKITFAKVVTYCMLVTVLLGVGRFIGVTYLNSNPNITYLPANTETSSLQKLITKDLKGKVVYVDFWGTSCGPCLVEFRNFIPDLKKRYVGKNVRFLYISQGSEYIWKRQVEKYNIEGFHLLLNEKQYENLYRNSIADSVGLITMPRYLIIDKHGSIVEANAKRPSDRESLFNQLNKYIQ